MFGFRGFRENREHRRFSDDDKKICLVVSSISLDVGKITFYIIMFVKYSKVVLRAEYIICLFKLLVLSVI